MCRINSYNKDANHYHMTMDIGYIQSASLKTRSVIMGIVEIRERATNQTPFARKNSYAASVLEHNHVSGHSGGGRNNDGRHAPQHQRAVPDQFESEEHAGRVRVAGLVHQGRRQVQRVRVGRERGGRQCGLRGRVAEAVLGEVALLLVHRLSLALHGLCDELKRRCGCVSAMNSEVEQTVNVRVYLREILRSVERSVFGGFVFVFSAVFPVRAWTWTRRRVASGSARWSSARAASRR